MYVCICIYIYRHIHRLRSVSHPPPPEETLEQAPQYPSAVIVELPEEKECAAEGSLEEGPSPGSTTLKCLKLTRLKEPLGILVRPNRPHSSLSRLFMAA